MVAQSLPGSMMPPSANMTIAPSYAARTRSAPANSNSGNSNSKPKRDSQRPLTHEEEAELERKKEHSRAKARERYRKMSSDRKAKKLAYTRTYHHNLTPEQQARYRRNQAIRNKEKKMTQHIVKSQQLHQEHHDEVQGYQFMQLSQHQQEFPVPLESVYKAVPVAKTETADSAVVAAAAVLVSPPAQHRTQDSNSPPWHAQLSSDAAAPGPCVISSSTAASVAHVSNANDFTALSIWLLLCRYSYTISNTL
ncbi:hypothetical protein GQ42DRAFT_158323 [Ramicandelaber brevisporus]|nr:hypothetical protein GQ42DRAFT_158496 [Ramicandelaber brevisporus]KAI8866953.1 hypothetical protein GQ42DRAFT_158323 [Ramicandelaber brevisporus]